MENGKLHNTNTDRKFIKN